MIDLSTPQNLDLSFEGFLYYSLVVVITLYVISYAVEFLLKRFSSLEDIDQSLLSRRIAALSIHFVVFLLLLQSFFVLFANNRFFINNLPASNSYEFWTRNRVPSNIKSDLQKLYFYATKTDITYAGYKESKLLLSIAMTINASFNGIDGLLMYLQGKGFSAEYSSLLIFHHWTIVWVESCIFNLDLLSIHPDWNWMFTLCGIILMCGCIGDLLLSPSTVQCFIDVKSQIYKKLLWIHLLFNVILLRGVGVSMIAFDFIVGLWQMDWKYGASFQITMIFMWLQWSNLGKAIFAKVSS